MTFVAKFTWVIISAMSHLFLCGLEKIFDDLTFQRMNALRKGFSLSSITFQTIVF